MSQIDERISQIAESLKDKVMAAPLQNGMEIVSRNNSSFLVLSGDLIGSELLAGLEWEPHVRECMERFADRDGVAVDAGASIGIHTVTLSRLFKKVYAFEPRLQMYRMLCANLVINNCHNVVACNQGLYDKTTSMRLMPAEKQSVPIELPDSHPDYSTPSNAAALAFGVTDQGDDGVRAVAIDSLALENVSLIKVDVQGSDAHVLRGALDTIRRCRPAVLFEWEKDLYEQRSASLDDVKDMLSGLNYKLTLLKETSPGRQADYCAEPL